MSHAVKSFLDWFDGFADNLTKAPNKAQWEKVVARIEALRQAAAQEPAPMARMPDVAFAPAPGAETSDGKTPAHTMQWWLDQVKAEIRKRGASQEDIDLLTADLKPDLNKMPSDAADELFEVI